MHSMLAWSKGLHVLGAAWLLHLGLSRLCLPFRMRALPKKHTPTSLLCAEDDKVMQAAAEARRRRKKHAASVDGQDAADDGGRVSVAGTSVKEAPGAGSMKKHQRKASFAALEDAPGDAQVVVTTRPGAGKVSIQQPWRCV